MAARREVEGGIYTMETVYVYFSTVMEVKRFVESISPLEGDFDLIDGRYIVDARSLMGIFGMNLTKPVQLRIHKNSKKAIRAIKGFIVEEPVNPAAVSPAVINPAASKPTPPVPQAPAAAPGTAVSGTASPVPRVILEEI